MSDILIVDDELGVRELLLEVLEDEGYGITLAASAAQARSARQIKRFDLVLLDIWMPDTDGVTLLKEWSAQGLLTMPVIMMSGHATIETAVEATRIGAFDFLEKPIALARLLKTVQAALARAQAQKAKQPAISAKAAIRYHTRVMPVLPSAAVPVRDRAPLASRPILPPRPASGLFPAGRDLRPTRH